MTDEGAGQQILTCEDCQALADALRSAWTGGDESQVRIIELAIDTHLTGIKHD